MRGEGQRRMRDASRRARASSGARANQGTRSPPGSSSTRNTGVRRTRPRVPSSSRSNTAPESLRAAQLDFFGPIGLVCALGMVAHFVQTLLTN